MLGSMSEVHTVCEFPGRRTNEKETLTPYFLSFFKKNYLGKDISHETYPYFHIHICIA